MILIQSQRFIAYQDKILTNNRYAQHTLVDTTHNRHRCQLDNDDDDEHDDDYLLDYVIESSMSLVFFFFSFFFSVVGDQ